MVHFLWTYEDMGYWGPISVDTVVMLLPVFICIEEIALVIKLLIGHTELSLLVSGGREVCFIKISVTW